MRLVYVLEEVGLHMFAPSAAPLGAVLPHQPEPGIRDDPFDDGRRDVRQLPAKLFPKFGRQSNFRNFVVVNEVDARRDVRKEGSAERVDRGSDDRSSDALLAGSGFELGFSETESFQVFADERRSVRADGGAGGNAGGHAHSALKQKTLMFKRSFANVFVLFPK